ncbi:P1 family peptidase [Halobacillus yeomjeoni]|uniref:DmpA family aminopeptidase n=1 Tax=Halobacillus yeomjeoni TaxID=311194 RepID=UPI001CD4E0AB|nr:P1 family peptidase [Halobacillus yeomjeoni]MCA0984811.1 P1 family peptidase [Halobacillus yeomjeoni]
MNLRIRDYGVKIGSLETGKLNKITDVAGVKVGHTTLSEGSCQTGVTAVIPHERNLFKEKLIASTHVINGFGKTMGTIQIKELGTLETPIVLTNTLNIGVAAEAVMEKTLETNPDIGRSTGSINPVVGECNDMYLNDLRAMFVEKEHVHKAMTETKIDFEEGCVGAGTGMLCYSLKGGVGSSSRTIPLEHGNYTLGVLVVTNFGYISDLRIDGKPVGEQLSRYVIPSGETKDRGSIMVIIATDLPVSERQLNRIIKRSVTGLSRTGSVITTGSGEVAIGFSTANKIPHEPNGDLLSTSTIHDDEIDEAFRAVGEATEEAVLNALIMATPVKGRGGNERPTLSELIEKYNLSLN